MVKRTKHEAREHAPLPPSASHRWGYCYPAMAYVERLIEDGVIVPRIAGEDAQRGTRIHELAEPQITARLQGKRAPARTSTNEEEVAQAAQYVNYIASRYDEADVLAAVVYDVETRAHITDLCWGSADFWLLAAGRLTVIDLKTGRTPVDADGNTQLLLYAMGIIETCLSKSEREKIREIEIVIFQPNADDDQPAERAKLYTRDQFGRWALVMHERIMYASQMFGKPRAELEAAARAGEWCQYCDALGVCPKAREFAMSISQKNFKAVTLANSSTKLPNPKELEAKQLAQILDRAPMFTEWLDAVRTRVIEIMQKGDDVPGYKVVAKKTRRVWSKDKTPATIAKKLGLPLAKIQKTVMLSPREVEAQLKGEKKKLVTTFTFKPFDMTIAKASDKRAAIPSTKISFKPVTREEVEDGD